MSLRVRAARREDLPRLLDLLAQDSRQYYGAEPTGITAQQWAAIDEIIADPAHDLLVGERGGEVVATCQLTWLRILSGDGALVCQVEAVRTEASLRGQGLGTTLMGHVEDLARERGAARLQLTSNRDRPEAHRFYERLGWHATHLGFTKYP